MESVQQHYTTCHKAHENRLNASDVGAWHNGCNKEYKMMIDGTQGSTGDAEIPGYIWILNGDSCH
jgi:hypothetical protein